MTWLLAGVAVLALVVAGFGQFGRMNPGRVARILVWLAAIFAAAVVLGFLARRLVGPAILALVAFAAIGLLALRSSRRPPGSASRRPGVSQIETPHLRMTLDQESGDIQGTVLAGRHAGVALDALSVRQLLDLLAAFRRDDEDSAQLLEAYLRRVHPDVDTHARTGSENEGSASMSVQQAHAILGLSPGASSDDILEAHRRLIRAVHPDQGGSDYLAAQINRARDILLGAI